MAATTQTSQSGKIRHKKDRSPSSIAGTCFWKGMVFAGAFSGFFQPASWIFWLFLLLWLLGYSGFLRWFWLVGSCGFLAFVAFYLWVCMRSFVRGIDTCFQHVSELSLFPGSSCRGFFPKSNYKINLHNISYSHHPHIHLITSDITYISSYSVYIIYISATSPTLIIYIIYKFYIMYSCIYITYSHHLHHLNHLHHQHLHHFSSS